MPTEIKNARVPKDWDLYGTCRPRLSDWFLVSTDSTRLLKDETHSTMNGYDLSDLLRNWPYEPGRINARRIVGADGRPRVQLRLDLGVLQFEYADRPDGLRPQGYATLMEYHRQRRAVHSGETGSAAGFSLSPQECSALREEAVQLHHRYVALFALRDFAAVIRDTSHSLDLFDLCREYGERETDRTILEQFRPQVIMMRTRCEAEMALERERPKEALTAIDHGLCELRKVFDDAGRGEEFDRANEVQLLRGMRDVLVPKLPASQKVELQERLRAALDAENYELAAILRDELRLM